MWHFTFVLTKYIQKLPQHFKSVADFKSFLSKKKSLSNDLKKEKKIEIWQMAKYTLNLGHSSFF